MKNIYTKSQQILCDTFTPISTFLSLRDAFANVSLFESSTYSTRTNSLSFIGVNPIVTTQINKDKLELRINNVLQENQDISTAEELTEVLDSFNFVSKDNAHQNGFFGVFGYDSISLFEDIKFEQESSNDLPTVFLAVYEFVLIFDHFHNQLTLLHNAFDSSANRLPFIMSCLNKSGHSTDSFKLTSAVVSSETDKSFKQKIAVAKDHILKGDVFQLVLSRQFSQSFEGDDFEVYRQLRTLNPSPYMFYFDLDKAKLIGASPEAQIKVISNRAEIHPIAGTVKKTEDEAENSRQIGLLQNDKKENAEHIMLVDLARNDLNQTCTNVEVQTLKEVQSFSHVIHLVSEVVGQVNNKSALQVFGGSFPAGTLSGAPKYRAMELIDKYENQNRGYYGGAIGLLAANGDVNMAIIIRTALSHKGKLIYQAGAGIVQDSTEDGECQEVYNKIKAVDTAIKNANKS